MPNHKAKKKGASTGNEQSNPGGSYKVSGSRNHEGNPVMEKKHDGSWRMCVDFTDLNKCLQGIPLNTDGGGRRGKTAFHTNQGVFCYTKISFGLKNAGATYQRLVDKAFVKQIGGNLEVYVDDLHARNQSLSIKSESGDEATITPNIERSSKPKRKAVDTKSGKGIPKHEKMYSGAANGNRTKTQRGADNVSLRSQGSSKRSPFDGKGLTASTSLFRQSLRRYFQAHPVVVITDQSIKQILSRPENTGRMLKWKFELEAFDITYRPRTSIRGQILADFITEKPNEEGPSMEVQVEEAIPEPWTLFTDGSSCLEGSGAGLILTNPEGEEFTYALGFEFDVSNNEAEAKEQSMTQYLEKAKTLINNFKMFSIEQVSRSKNKKAGALSKIASTSFAHLTKQVLVETLKRKSIEEWEILAIVEEEGYC
ncbi:reverse transcriptase domain-containing protein [Tanacetum coccineum]